MAILTKSTIQKLAILRVLAMWSRGAFGQLRLQKTLFFTDAKNDPEWRLFTFKKWRLGQYSDEIADGLNDLRVASRIATLYDGPCERIKAEVEPETERRISRFFRDYFSNWNKSLTPAFRAWAYLSHDDIIQKAHADASYHRNEHGDVIHSSFKAKSVEFDGLSDDDAERLTDVVDARFWGGLEDRASLTTERTAKGEDWRKIYFGEDQPA